MKKIILTLVIILSAFQLTFAQWVGTTNMYNTNTGNVGVGITSPTALFHVSSLQYIPAASGSAQNSGFRLGAAATTNLVLDAGVNTSGGVYTWLQSRNQSDYSLNYSLILNPNGGNVGIGTNNPNYLLTVGSSSNRGTLNIIGGTTQTPAISLSDIRTGGTQFTMYSGLSAAGNFDIFDQVAGTYRLTINASGNVSIGTTNSKGYMFAVNGTAIATSMTVKPYANWPDYVFKPTYHLLSLADVKTYIDKNQHLPEMPSAEQIAKDGLNLGEMNTLLTKKVEELTLYLIERDAKVKQEEDKINRLEQQLAAQQAQVDKLNGAVEKLLGTHNDK